jgi:TRAP-type C4-dicarboxylate transport system permease small subunit
MIARLLIWGRWLFVWGAGFCVSAMTLLIAAEVMARALGGRGFIWLVDVTGLLLLVFFFACLPFSWNADAHVRMDLLYNKFSSAARKWVDAIGTLGALVFLLAIGIRCAIEVPHMWAVGVGSQTISIPHWPFAVILTLFTGLATVLMLAQTMGLTQTENLEGPLQE